MQRCRCRFLGPSHQTGRESFDLIRLSSAPFSHAILGAWLGLVPRQHTTGGKPRLLGISKRGNTYLRTLLIHGARASLPSISRSDTPLGRWLKAMLERGVHRNAAVVALANKLARIAWAALRKGATFERSYPVAI